MAVGQPNMNMTSATGGRSCDPSTGRMRHVYGALDLGTNNCRLLVAHPIREGGFQVVDAFSRIVRLGEGVGATGALSEAAINRTIEALKVCGSKMRRRKVTRARAVATEVCRQAANSAGFVSRVRDETGLELDIITPGEEAQLALDGCAPLLDYSNRHALVFDIGGGSTELMWLRLEKGKRPVPEGFISIPCGVVNLAERFGGVEVDLEKYRAMCAEVERMLAPFGESHRIREEIEDDAVQFLGISGTVTTLAGIHLELERYDRSRVDGTWLEFGDALDICMSLAMSDYDSRLAHPCIGKGRADLVVAGCAILEAIYNHWPGQRLRVADRGVREGLLVGLMRAADQDAAH